MGRHSDPDPRWFWQSLAVAAGKLLALVILAVVVVAGVVRLTGDDNPVPTPPADGDAGDATVPPDADGDSAFETEPALEGDDSADDSADDEDADSGDDEDADGDEAGEDEDGGDDAPVRATVQVLNASGNPDLLDQVVAVLEELGFQVVATGRAARGYDETTVLWSEGFQDEARSLRRDDPRFGEVQRNDRLDPTIDLHVVIGADWRSDSDSDSDSDE